MDEVKYLKQIVDDKRNSATGRGKIRYSEDFWDRVIKLTESMAYPKVANLLGISPANLRRRMLASKPKVKKKDWPNQFIEIPLENQVKSKKQIILDLPYNVTLRIEL